MKRIGLTRRAALRSMGSLALTLGVHLRGAAAEIVAVRVWPAADYSRVTLESDSPLAAKHFLTTDPPRLVVDIEGLELNMALRELVGKVQTEDPFISNIRVGQFQPHTVRLVVDLKQGVLPQVFSLDPVAAYRHRLVFDLHPTLVSCQDSNAACSLALKPDGVVASRRHSPSYDSSSRLASGLDGGAIKRHLSPDTTQEPDPLLALVKDKTTAQERAAQSVQDALGEFLDRTDHINRTKPAPRETPAVTKEANSERIDRLIIVAIDPGHGGEDPGAIGPSGLQEKEVVLSIALQLRERLKRLPNMRAIMTRDRDFFVPLGERVKKARQVQADLFVSIHADAFLKPHAKGASVFALSQGSASSSTARWMASRENAADLVGGVNLKAQDTSILETLLDMSTTAQIKDSMRLGAEVLGQIGKVGALHKAQVEQAGFAVLKAPDIPSILVETAFISNPEEEAKLANPEYQAQLVEALAIGIERYFAKHPPLARKRRV